MVNGQELLKPNTADFGEPYTSGNLFTYAILLDLVARKSITEQQFSRIECLLNSGDTDEALEFFINLTSSSSSRLESFYQLVKLIEAHSDDLSPQEEAELVLLYTSGVEPEHIVSRLLQIRDSHASQIAQ